MERWLRKSGIYGLLLGLAIAILFVDYKEVAQMSNGVTQTFYKSEMEYVVSVLRFSVIGMFLGLFIGWVSYERKHETQKTKTYYLAFFFVSFLVSTILMFG